MNELYVYQGYFYFKTKSCTVGDAIAELRNACEKVGIEFASHESAYLRDSDGEDIDSDV